MPMLIQDADFNRKLIDAERNQLEANTFLENGVDDYHVESIDLSSKSDYRLLISRKPHTYEGFPCKKIRLIYTGGDTPEIIYAVNLVIADHVIHGKHCTQVLVWRTAGNKKHREVLGDLPMLMFEHFIEEYVVIVSDTEQTENGRSFWINRINEAMQDGLFVYFVDMNELDDELVPILNRIEVIKEFYEKWNDHGWGKDEEYKDRLFVISKESLID